jgi:hypothetical protein
MLGATGRDQVTSIVVLYGPRTTALVACDDGVYEFTCGAGNKWFASREKIQIKQVLARFLFVLVVCSCRLPPVSHCERFHYLRLCRTPRSSPLPTSAPARRMR